MAEVRINDGAMNAEITKDLLAFYDEIGPEIETLAKANAAVDQGILRRWIRWYVEGITLVIRSGSRHSAAVEFGARPHWPPKGALAAWAKKRGIPEYLVRRKIARSGTPAQPFLRPAILTVLARRGRP